MASSIDQVAADFAAVGNPIRLKILEYLSDRAYTSDEPAGVLVLRPDDLDKHLRRLSREGWVQTDKHSFHSIRDRSGFERIRCAAPEILPKLPPLPE